MSARPDYVHDTIVAPATPPGKGGIGVVRLSGADVERIAVGLLGKLPGPRYAKAGAFHDASGDVIDTGIALYFPKPASFTGESVLELQCHGGPVVVSMLVDAAIALGARHAEPGEFSQRAFLNDKLDLVQVEAIADLIDSGTVQAAKAAQRSLAGVFSTAVTNLAELLVQLRLHVEAAIDFPEEEIDFLADTTLLRRVNDCAAEFERLLTDAGSGRALRDGLRVVIAGKPNVGKSSLMNRLSGVDRAIVTDIEGTTRDLLHEHINIGGLSVEFIDTAGLRNNAATVEKEGIRRALDVQATADLILWVQDATQNTNDATHAAFPDGVAVLNVVNKIDLTQARPGTDTSRGGSVHVSALRGTGVDLLREKIVEIAGVRDVGEGAFTARRRHVRALENARTHFLIGKAALTESGAGEILAEELRLAQKALARITGDVSSDELLGRIFSEFCIGK